MQVDSTNDGVRMLSDRAPFEYLYMSRRLLTDLVQHDEAARPRVKRELSFNFKWISYQGQRRPPDLGNPHDLASRSLDLVSDHAGGLDDQWSPYVHAEIQLSSGVFTPLIGWNGGTVACFRGEVTTTDGLSVFVALFGSASNLVGYRSGDDAISGFTPSDMTGLYALLDAVREPDDPEISLQCRLDDQALAREHVAQVAIEFARSGARQGSQTLTFLARRLLPVDGYRGREDKFDRVLIGAPLWVATPAPMPALRGIPSA
jgi:hypothetical protein